MSDYKRLTERDEYGNADMGLRLILQEIEPSVSFYLGKRLFFTKTEAEARLKELQEKQK